MKQLQRISLFAKVVIGATRSNHQHSRKSGRPKLSWWGAIPWNALVPLWAITDPYTQMDTPIGVENFSFNEEGEDNHCDVWWETTHIEGCGLTVYMATKEWRDQGSVPGIIQFNPHRWCQEGYYLCFMVKERVLPLPWLWGSIIPHPRTLTKDREEAEEERNVFREGLQRHREGRTL